MSTAKGDEEAHIPLRGGKVPVKVSGNKSTVVYENHVHVEGNTFYDKEKMTQVMAQVSEQIAFRVTPRAYAYDWHNDGITRRLSGRR